MNPNSLLSTLTDAAIEAKLRTYQRRLAVAVKEKADLLPILDWLDIYQSEKERRLHK